MRYGVDVIVVHEERVTRFVEATSEEAAIAAALKLVNVAQHPVRIDRVERVVELGQFTS